MTIAVGQHTNVITTTTGATSAQTPGITTAASGSSFLIAAAYFDNGGTPTVATPTDSKGNTYTLIGATTSFVGTVRVGIWLCQNGVGDATGNHKATVSWTGTAVIVSAFFVEITGGALSGLLDQTASPQWNDDTSSPFTSNATAATTQANELCFAFAVTASSSGTETLNWSANSYTQVDASNNASNSVTCGIATKSVSSTGTQQVSLTSSGAGTTEALVTLITLVQAAGGGATGSSPIFAPVYRPVYS